MYRIFAVAAAISLASSAAALSAPDGSFTPGPVMSREKAPGLPSNPCAGITPFEIRVSTSAAVRGSNRLTNNCIFYDGAPLLSVLAAVWGVAMEDIILDVRPAEFLNVSLRTRDNGVRRGRELLRSAIEEALDIKTEFETRTTDVFLLSLDPALKTVLKPAMVDSSGGVYDASGLMSMSWLASSLRYGTGRPVIDETGLAGEYEIDLRGDIKASSRALSGLGLRLVPARREVKYLRVSPAPPRKPALDPLGTE